MQASSCCTSGKRPRTSQSGSRRELW